MMMFNYGAFILSCSTMILTRRKLTRRKLTRMVIINATFQIKLMQTPQGIFKTHKINANDV